MMARILVVDDDPDILETLQYALERQGHEVCAYADGRLALEAARQAEPEAAVLDVMLPGLNGYEVSRLLKEDIPWTMITVPFPSKPTRLTLSA